MKDSKTKKDMLYRRVNTRTHNVRHGTGGEARWHRNTKAARSSDAARGKMRAGLRHGLDYTPLYKFLLSRVGRPWDATFSEAKARLDSDDAIFRMVARSDEERRPIIRTGESSYFSGLYIDGDGLLQKVDPTLSAKNMTPGCHCCTHTFNGDVFGLKKMPDDFGNGQDGG